MKSLARIFFIFLSAFLCTQSFAQRTALILSGGGAKGTAHIGVIRALEEYDIPIDYVAGTSIGAIIGGMYAAGYTTEEMEAIVTAPDFQKWAYGEIDDRYSFYFKKEAPNASWVELDFEIGKSINPILPTNIINPYLMEFQFMEFFAGPSAAADYNFNNLFLPFRCIAADIDSNQAIVLKRGDLGSAVRASMTFPFYFKPIERDGKLLFDGGMYNNFPADVALETWQPELIIGSKVAGNYSNPDKNNIVSQIQNMLMAKTNYTVILNNGVLIEPKTGNVDVIDFSRAKAFIDSGYRETLRNMPDIIQAINSFETQNQRVLKREAFRERIPPIIIDSVHITGVRKRSSDYIRRQFIRKNDSISLQEAREAYFRLLANDQVQYIFPQLKYKSDRQAYTLELDVEEAHPFEVQFGGSIASNTTNEGFMELKYRKIGHHASLYKINAYFGQFYKSFYSGFRLDFPGKNPLALSGSFCMNYKDYFKNKTYFFFDENPSYLLQEMNNLNANVSSPVKATGKIEFGVDVGMNSDEYYQNNQFSRTDTADQTDFDYFSPYMELDINSLNRKQYASSGVRFRVLGAYIVGEERMQAGSTGNLRGGNEYEKTHHIVLARAIYDNYFEHIGKLKLGFYGEICVSDYPLRANYTSTILAAPAFEPIPEMKSLFLPAYRAHNFVAGGLKFIYPVMRKLDFRLEGYVFQPYQQIVQNEELQAGYGEKWQYRSYLASTSLVYHTFLGPASINLNYYDHETESFSMVFRFGFLLFNRSPWK